MEKKSISIVSCKLERNKLLKSNFKITNSNDVINLIVNNFNDLSQEYLFTINLNNKNIPQNISIISIGSINQTFFDYADFFRPALLSNSNKIIMLHNHPSRNNNSFYYRY